MSANRNPVGWFEIYVDDMDRAKSFYETVFQITLESLPSDEPTLEMWSFPMGEESMTQYGAPGALCKMDGCQAGAGGVLIYFSCDDCSVEAARVADAGGKVIKPKFAIGEYGFISIIEDCEGNSIGLHSLQ